MLILSLSVTFVFLYSETAIKDKRTDVVKHAFLEDSFHLSLFLTNNFGLPAVPALLHYSFLFPI